MAARPAVTRTIVPWTPPYAPHPSPYRLACALETTCGSPASRRILDGEVRSELAPRLADASDLYVLAAQLGALARSPAPSDDESADAFKRSMVAVPTLYKALTALSAAPTVP